MQQNFKDIEILFSQFSVEQIINQKPVRPFLEETVLFLNELSKELNRVSNIRNFPDVSTFAFFCRRASILKIKKNYDFENNIRLGRGLVFHIAPSNVPVNFAYSLFCGLLAGNVNIVRVPSKDFEQVRIICDAIARIAPTHSSCTSRINLIRYDKTSNATDFFSSVCDVRIIWGGDFTISQIRKSIIPPRSFDVTFADRYSICAINAARYLSEANFDALAQGFYNDTYLFDQNACTAPHLMLWIGSVEEVAKAKSVFWEALYKQVKRKYGQVQPVIAVDKLTALFNQAICNSGVHLFPSDDNLLWRIEVDELMTKVEDFRCSSGYFTEYHGKSLYDLTKIINRKFQTLAYYGFDKTELTSFVLKSGLSGIDRIIPIGRTSDFSVIWDGFDLVNTLSRIVSIE